MKSRSFATLCAALVGSLALSACGAAGTGNDGDSGRPKVLASFYPLEYLATEIGGDHFQVESMTPAGAEPHDLELSISQTRELSESALVLYLSEFQPAVDDAIEQRKPEKVLDVADGAQLLSPDESGGAEAHSEEEHAAQAQKDSGQSDHSENSDNSDHSDHSAEPHEEHTEDAHAEEGAHAEEDAPADAAATDDAHDHGAFDPHFWLDPTRMADVAESVGAEMAEVDPDNAAEYEKNTADLVKSLKGLDQEFEKGLANCEDNLLVTNHESFGYLADRYGLEQIGISGIDSTTEPSPARLKEVSETVREHTVSTIYFESTASPKVVETLAKNLGVEAEKLDPIESVADGSDYMSVMHENLSTLGKAMGCA